MRVRGIETSRSSCVLEKKKKPMTPRVQSSSFVTGPASTDSIPFLMRNPHEGNQPRHRKRIKETAPRDAQSSQTKRFASNVHECQDVYCIPGNTTPSPRSQGVGKTPSKQLASSALGWRHIDGTARLHLLGHVEIIVGRRTVDG